MLHNPAYRAMVLWLPCGEWDQFPNQNWFKDLPGGPVAKTLLPMQGAWIQSLARELDPLCHN